MDTKTQELSICTVITICVTICFYVFISSISSCSDTKNGELQSKNYQLLLRVKSAEANALECTTNLNEVMSESEKLKEDLKYKNILSEIVSNSMKANDDKLSAIKEIMK